MSRLRAREALESPSPCPLPDEGKRGPVSVQNEPAVSFAATVHLNARSKAFVPGAACNQAVELPESVLGQIACRDNLAFMAELPDGCCDLIYADPPFNMDRPVEPTKYGSANYQSRFVGGIDGHLRFLVPRLEQMRRLLSRRGLLFVHLNWRSVHYVKVELDRLFGESNFVNEIIWSYRSGGRPGKWFARNNETILGYANCVGEHTFHPLRDGAYRTKDLKFDQQGRPYKSTRSGRLYFHPDGPMMSDVWDVPFLSTVSKERTGYPTQKPEALLERIVRAASSEGDVIADFFCGSGTTLAVARRMKRRWLGCDESPDAVDIARRRIEAISADEE